MTDRELMQQALDALEGYARNCRCEGGGAPCDAAEALRARLANEFDPDWDVMAVMVEEQQRMAKRIEELEAALAQPEQEHSEQWWRHEVSNAWAEGYEKGRASVKQPKQEQCHHKFEIDQEAPSHSCCQMCGEVRKQPEQEPVAWITTWNEPNDAGVELHWAKQDKGLSSKHTPLFYKSTMNTDSKPVGWLYQTNNTWEQFSFIEPPDDAYDEGSLRPVYTAPPQRDEAPAKAVEWQGLTDEEILEEYRQSYGDDGNLTDIYFAHAIEAKLKEKNAL